MTVGSDEIALNRLFSSLASFLSSSSLPLWECTHSVCLSEVFDQKQSAEKLCFELNRSCGKFPFCCLGQYRIEAILCSQNSWNMAGTFNMWRWISCCFLELQGCVCQQGSQSVDLRGYKYLYIRLCLCFCTQTHRCSCALSHFPSLTGALSDMCHAFKQKGRAASGHQGNVIKVLYEADEPRTDSNAPLLVFTSLSLVWVDLFIFFFHRKTLITD